MCNCRFCCKGENFAYFVVNNNEKDSRILIRSGGGPLTNADRIREMSDKEISVLLSAVKFRRECFIKIPDFLSIQDAYKWLQQVAEEER